MGLFTFNFITCAGPPNLEEELHQIHLSLRRIEQKERTQMATSAEILAIVTEANDTTNNIAADIQRLIDRPDVPDDVKVALQAHVDALKQVAAVVPE